MALSDELISQLVKVTNDREAGSNDVTVYGTVVSDGERNYVRLDGSDVSTPIETTVEVSPDDRVIVNIKNHTATVTGNTTDPAIGTKRADGIESSITQTASEIRAEITDEVNGLNSKITQNADNITTLVSNQSEFSEFKQTVEGFSFMGTGGTVKISGGDIELSGAISFSDLSDSDTIQSEIDTANASAAIANTNASNAITTISGFTITESSKTYIDGKMIYSDSIYANKIHLGGQLTVYKSMYEGTEGSTDVGGYIGYCTGWNSNSGIGVMHSISAGQCICTDQAARLSFGSGASFVAGPTVAYIDGPSNIQFEIGGTQYVYISDSTMSCYAAHPINLGTSSTPWSTVYASTCTGTTSDRNKKNSIEDLPEKYVVLFDGLKPKRFKMNDGTSDRYHVGYIAQEVEEAMIAANVDSQEFGGFIRDKDEDENEVFMLRYGEFDAIRDAKIKQLEARIVELEKLLAQ